MKILKYLLFLVLIFLIAGAIYVATKGADYEITEEIIIDAPRSFVFSEVENFENWKNWAAMVGSKASDISISGKAEGEAATMSWRSDDNGSGSVSNLEIVPEEKIVQKLTRDHTFGTSTSTLTWIFEEIEGKTKVKLLFNGEMSFKDKLYWETSGNGLETSFQPMLAQGLQQLDENIKTQMAAYNIKIHGITEYGGGYFMYTSTSARQDNVQQKFAEIYPQIKSFMTNNSINDNGRPFILYHDWNDENGTALFSVAVPTATKVVTPYSSDVLSGYMPTQRVVRTSLKGDRKNLTEAWDETFKYIEQNGLKVVPNFQPFEVYITNANKEKVPSRLITEIYIPVSEEQVE